jgi:hypothetical protein
MRHRLLPKDDISERNSTESPVICPLRVYVYGLLADWLVRLKETAPKTLKGQITATGSYRYRLEGIVHAAFHIRSIKNSIKRVISMSLRDNITRP